MRPPAHEHNLGVWGDSKLIAIDPEAGELLGSHDRRRNLGKAAGY
jgi:gamma-glutamyltranspeptidase/glutathione hydrolase